MTREEAIKELSYIADEMPSMECGDWKEAIYMAIKALEQEPVLNKIRAEIKALSNANPSYWHDGDMVDRDDVLDIIDKYKANKHEPKQNIKALGEDMRICQKSITDEKVLIGFNMAVAICNKHLAESEEVSEKL